MNRPLVTLLAALAVCTTPASSGLSSQFQAQTTPQPCAGAQCVTGPTATGAADPAQLSVPAESENAGDYGLVVLLAALVLIALVIVTRQRAGRRDAARATSPATLHLALDELDPEVDQPGDTPPALI
jgi:hypothetical protein